MNVNMARMLIFVNDSFALKSLSLLRCENELLVIGRCIKHVEKAMI
mgnify:FL=1